MATGTETAAQPRIPLNRERVLRAAIVVADEGGIEALTMRKLADEVGVEAMSLYYHVANKEAVLDGVVDAIVVEIEESMGGFTPPDDPADWQEAVRERILAARNVMLLHPWVPAVLETRTKVSPTMVLYFNSLLGLLREGGFSYDLAHHGVHALGSRILGFTQELFEPDEDADSEADEAALLEELADQIPYVVGMLMEITHDDPDSTLGWCDDQVEFEFGLDLILDGLERLRSTA
ncbi:MAG: TetR/AcrR family transcriptional regulator C-terminal domain-containing protein [Acidimicrobiia bacterium]|nr:MAG: TetR/AcrR family transcriptional regulator C-terminal domain-containing protein [Acidimicrobiia bacterium]